MVFFVAYGLIYHLKKHKSIALSNIDAIILHNVSHHWFFTSIVGLSIGALNHINSGGALWMQRRPCMSN